MNVNWRSLLPVCRTMMKLQGRIQEVALSGVEEAYAKHTDAEEAKGIKAHFRMDDSGLLSLDLVSLNRNFSAKSAL